MAPTRVISSNHRPPISTSQLTPPCLPELKNKNSMRKLFLTMIRLYHCLPVEHRSLHPDLSLISKQTRTMQIGARDLTHPRKFPPRASKLIRLTNPCKRSSRIWKSSRPRSSSASNTLTQALSKSPTPTKVPTSPRNSRLSNDAKTTPIPRPTNNRRGEQTLSMYHRRTFLSRRLPTARLPKTRKGNTSVR